MTQSPRVLLNFAVLGVAALAFLSLSVVLTAPYSGFMLGYDEDLNAIRVVKAEDWVKEQGLQLGDSVVSITNAAGTRVEIERKHILLSPEEARLYFGNRSERLIEIDRMHDVLATSSIVVTKDDGTTATLILEHKRPIAGLSSQFWTLLIISLTVPLVASVVWAWQPKKPEAILLLISSLGFFGTCFSSTVEIYANDMLYYPIFLHWLIRAIQDMGQLTFTLFGAAVLLYYPNQLRFASTAIKILVPGYFCYAIFSFLNGWAFNNMAGQKYPSFNDAEAYSAMVAMFSLTVLLCWRQYRVSANHPVQRAQTLWVILAWTIGPGVFVIFYVLPRWLGDGPILYGSVFLNSTILTTFLMILLGIARINLFQLEQYIGQAYQWVILSILFIGLDITLISLVNFSPQVSSAIVLVAAIWVYMPLRQWAQRKLTAGQRDRTQALTSEAVVLMVQNSLDPNNIPRDSWRQIIDSLFKPGAIKTLDSSVPSSIAMRGQQLIIRDNNYSPALQLDFAEAGSRLFVKRDLSLAETLSVLFEKLYDVRDSFLEGQTQERNRIRRDLHDQIGHKLLSLIYSAGDDRSRSLAQETMAQLSELIQALKQKPINLEELAARMHSVCEEICTNAKLKLDWDNSIPDESLQLISSDQFLNILNILRELLSNTIKHAEANRVKVSLALLGDSIRVIYTDDGTGFDQKSIKPGNGLFNLQSRSSELKAKMEWDTMNGTKFKLDIPFDSKERNHG